MQINPWLKILRPDIQKLPVHYREKALSMRTVPLILLFILTLPPLFGAEDSASARQLHEKECLACHGTDIYTRPNRLIHTKDALVKQVRLCQSRADLGWDGGTIRNVAEYLDTTYYRFTK
jgi:hypothetical protein